MLSIFSLLLMLFSSFPSVSAIQPKIKYEDQEYTYQVDQIDPNQDWTNRDLLLTVTDRQSDTMVHRLRIEEFGIQEVAFFGKIGANTFLLAVEHSQYIESFQTKLFLHTEWFFLDVQGQILSTQTHEEQYLNYVNVLEFCAVQTKNHQLNRILEDFSVVPINNFAFEGVGKRTLRCSGECQIEDSLDRELLTSSIYRIRHTSLQGYSQTVVITLHSESIHEESNALLWMIEEPGQMYINHYPADAISDRLVPGNYTIEIYGANAYYYQQKHVIPFTISGVPSSDVKDVVKVYANCTNMSLNGDTYQSGDFISKAGFYRMVLEGINQYVEVYTFRIRPYVRGVIHQGQYTKPITLSLNSKATLNGQPIEDQYQIKESGVYQLHLYHENDIVETIQFELNLSEDVFLTPKTGLPWFEIVLSVMALIGIYLVFKKK